MNKFDPDEVLRQAQDIVNGNTIPNEYDDIYNSVPQDLKNLMEDNNIFPEDIQKFVEFTDSIMDNLTEVDKKAAALLTELLSYLLSTEKHMFFDDLGNIDKDSVERLVTGMVVSLRANGIGFSKTKGFFG